MDRGIIKTMVQLQHSHILTIEVACNSDDNYSALDYRLNSQILEKDSK
ncbi:hypothetical protein SLEP1_g20343 [Rubroshorea leprosula]|uniref:Uncharacterized protein n=1 Tax=Rubroshorea leprosula TaxID=152421 RepID=A0AAV5J7S3_9ROSI|nr:hypothetical protein SLEP1_g20343 [Rubroshorea leprosula]